jgi:hypothetical protein
MGVETTSSTTVTCDNPNCPGDSGLDPSQHTGWLFVTHEIYGEPTQSNVFCCAMCLSVVSGNETSAQEFGFTKVEPAPEETPTEAV